MDEIINMTVSDIIDQFSKLYNENRSILFEFLEGDTFSLQDKKAIFDGLSAWKDKGKFYNLMTSTSRTELYDYIKSLDPEYADTIKSRFRQQAVDNAVWQEIDLLDEGYCTRDWDIEQLREMYQYKNGGTEFKANPGKPHQFDLFDEPEFTVSVVQKGKNKGKVNINEKPVAGHHMMAVQTSPEFMADGKTIQFLDVTDHLQAHGGNDHNATLAFFDGENYIGIKYNESYVDEFGELIDGEFVGDGKMYKFVSDDGTLGHFEEIIVDSDTYSNLLGRKIPPRKISTKFPSVKEASCLLGGKIVSEYTAEELFNARLGIAEYRNLGIDVNKTVNPEVAEYLKNVGADSSQLSRTTVILNEEGNIDEVILKVSDTSEEIKIVSSGAEPSASRYAVTAADYKKMTALPDDITKESIGLRYHGTEFDNLTPIEKLKLRKADAVFAEKSLYLSLDDLDEVTRKNLIDQMIQIADDPELANKAVFSFDQDGRIVGFDLSGELSANTNGVFSAKFSELRNAPSDISIMRDYHAFGYSSLDEISALDMHKMRAGIAMYEKLGNDDLDALLKLTRRKEVNAGKAIREHLLAIADDPASLSGTQFFFDEQGNLTAIGKKKPASAKYSLTATEVKDLPTDYAMRSILNSYDELDDADKFILKRAVVQDNADEFMRVITEQAADDAEGIAKLINKTDNSVKDTAVLLERTSGDYGRAAELVTQANDDARIAIKGLECTGDNIDETARIIEKLSTNSDDFFEVAAHANNYKAAEELYELTGKNRNLAISLLDSLDGEADDAVRIAERVGADNIEEFLRITESIDTRKMGDTLKLVDELGGNTNKLETILNASKGDPSEAFRVLKNTDSVEDAVRIFDKFGGEISEADIRKKYTFLREDPELCDFYRRIEYKIALGADPASIYVGEMFNSTKMRFVEDNWILFKDIKELRVDDFLHYAMNEPAPTINGNGLKSLERVRGEIKLTSAIRKGVGIGVNAVSAVLDIYNTVKFICSMAEGLENGTLLPRDVGKETDKYILETSCSWIFSQVTASATIAVLGALAVNPVLLGVAAIVFAVGAGIAGTKFADWIADTLYDPAYNTVWSIIDWFGVNVFGGEYHLLEGTNQEDEFDFTKGRIKNGLIGYNITNPIDIECFHGDDIVHGSIYGDTIRGNEGNDVLYGYDGNDKIYGNEGNDELHGEYGNDTIEGGSGVNLIYGEQGNDKLIGGDEEDYIYGGDDNDTIYGNDGSDYLFGEKGEDDVYGGRGDDYIEGGIDNDNLYGEDGEDYITGGDGEDYIEGGKHTDVIIGGEDADTIHGETKDERFSKNGYDDYLSGGNGNDKIYGGAGNDSIWGDGNNDTIEGGYGDDTIDGGLGNDTISGGEGYDTLMGDTGDDTIYGGNGDDTIDGGFGVDNLYGSDGNDTYVFNKDIFGNASNRGSVNDHDTVFDSFGYNTVLFQSIPQGLDSFHNIIRFEKSSDGHDLIISSKQTGASMKIVRYFDNKNFRFKLETDPYNTFSLNDDLKLEKDKHHGGSGGSTSSMSHLIDDSKTVIIKDYKTASQAQPPRDPLVIDINGDGVHTTGVVDGVHFDIDNNGFAEQTEWIDRIDGFLVYDRDGDGRITNGSELFSDQVYLPDGTRLKDGFAVLETFDKDKNGFVSGKELDNIMVWIDKNHDGKSFVFEEGMEINPEDQELFTMDELGITSISTQFTIPEEDEDKPIKNLIADVIKDGDLTTISEHWFEADTADTLELKTEGVDDDLTSFGSLHSITYFVEQLGDTYVSELVDRFNESEDYAEKRLITRKLLYHISGAENIDRNSRGYYIDARDLHVLETIMGSGSFVGVGNSNNPNTNAAAILKEMYNKFEELYFNILNQNSNASDVLNLICEVVDDAGKVALNIDDLNEALDSISDTDGKADNLVCSVCSYLKAYDNAHNTNYLSQFINAHPDANETFNRYINASFMLGTGMDDKLEGTNANEVFWGEDGNDTINAANGNDTIYGGEGNDTLNSGAGNDIAYGGAGNDIINGNSGNDVLYGEEGNDTINGETGDDVIYAGAGDDVIDGGEGSDVLYGEEDNDSLNGGTGDDKLYGGVGDDKYYFNTDHGNDTVYDSEGLSTLVFGDEISADAYRMNIDISSGISLVNDEIGETIEIPDFINVPELYDFEFEDGSGMIGGGETRQVIEGTDGDDTITAGDGFNIIRGGEGNDNITGGDNLNFIYGGDGDDTITGGNGTNIIRGEDGNDIITDGSGSSYIDGGNGNDVIHAGDGNDIIIGGFGADQLYGEDGDDVIAGNAGDDEIDGGNGDDTVYADNGSDTVHGGDGNDSLFGGNGDDVLYGDEGDDYLEAGNGEDTLYGGEGNDVFVGGTGVNNMYGDEGDDIFHGGNGINNMYGGEGDDTFTGGELADYIEGGNGNDTMNGGNGENRMFGNDGDDQIYGGNDDDYIEGGEGDDKLYGGNGINTIYGGTGNDKIFDGDENSFLYGGDGDDEIRAGGGSDVLDGGAGNDYLQSDHGGDTYVFGVGYDVDTIHASADLNTIVIHGYTAEDMHNTRMPNNALVVDFGTDTGDKLVIEGFFNFNSNREFNFVFDDDTVLEQDQIEAVNAPIYGTSGDDTLFAVDSTGWNIIGGEGNDKLNGGEGNDILDGGIGNDVLNGGTGANTYVYGVGYDIDTIEASADSCTIIIHGYNVADMDSVRETDKSLAISFGAETGDKLIIKSFYEDYLDRNYQFVFDDGAVLGKSDINAKAAPIIGTDGDDNIYATNGDDIIDGGAGNDSLAGSNGEDTYIFGKGYDHDTINEWGIDHSFVELKDINSDGVTISNQWGSNLIVSVNDTEDVLTVSNFKWGQASYTFKFADGAEGYVDKNTWELVLTKQPDIVEDIEQAGAELLNEIYSNEGIDSDLISNNDNTVIDNITNSVNVSDENVDIADLTDIQAMILAENMSAFGDDSLISTGLNIGDITSDTSALDQLLVSSSIQ